MPTTKKDKQRVKLLKKAFWIAKHEQGMTPDQFREAVPSWGFPRLSDCEAPDLRQVIGRMKRWFTATDSSHTCSQSQLDYLQGLWEQKSRAKTKKALKKYLVNNFDVVKPRDMGPGLASRAINSIKKWN